MTRTLVVAWASADWRVAQPLAESGQLPCLGRLIDGGVMSNLAVRGPTNPAPCWTTLATGVQADRHGVLACAEAGNGALSPTASASWSAPAFWRHAAHAGRRCIVVGWPFTHPFPEESSCTGVSDAFCTGTAAPPPGSIQPAAIHDILAELRVRPDEIGADELRPFVPRLDRVDRERDTRPARIASLLARAASLHAAATWFAEHRSWDLLVVCYPALAAFSREFAAYHPPLRPGIPETEYDLYGRVLSGAYRFHDMMLGRLIQLAGEDVHVVLVSDHGYHCDAHRPHGGPPVRVDKERLWHRNQGILCMSGPRLRQDERIYGATMLDIAPTVLWLLGVPVPAEMAGRVLESVADGSPSVAKSDAVAPPRPPVAQGDPGLLLSWYEECGWLDAGAADAPAAIESERHLVAARAHLAAGRAPAAARLLEEALRIAPREVEPAVWLALAKLASNDVTGCREFLTRHFGAAERTPIARLLFGLLLAAEGRREDALAELEQASADPSLPPGLHCERGRLYLQLERPAEAEQAFRAELDIDPGNAQALHGLSVACLLAGRASHAADAARAAIANSHDFPEAHFQLGLALMRQGQPLNALIAFETCLSLRPDAASAHRWLAAIHERHTRNARSAVYHKARAAELESARRTEN